MQMGQTPITQRVFRLQMAKWLPTRYESYLLWLRWLLERLGAERTLTLWEEACQGDGDWLTSEILSNGWQETAQEAAVDVEARIAAALAGHFPARVEGVSGEMARRLVEGMPPICQVWGAFASFNMSREVTAYQALHLSFDGLARLVEGLIHHHGRQGELIAYDILSEERVRSGGGRIGSVAEFMADFIAQPSEANLFTAGLETELIRASEAEVVLHVRACEWARYYRERHPAVGYLMACSTDEAAFRAFNPGLRLQRTTTLMEGGEVCDFRIYVVESETKLEKK